MYLYMLSQIKICSTRIHLAAAKCIGVCSCRNILVLITPTRWASKSHCGFGMFLGSIFLSCMTHMLKYIRTCLAHSLSKQTKDISRLNRVDWAPAERRDFLRAWNAMAKPTLLGKANEIYLNSRCLLAIQRRKQKNEPQGFQFTWSERVSVHVSSSLPSMCATLVTSMQPWTKKKSLQTAQRCRCKLLSGWTCCGTRFAHRLCWFCNIGNFQLKSCCCLSLGVASNYFGYEDFQPHLFLIVAGSKFFSVFSLSKQGQPLRRAICACKSCPKKNAKKYGTVASTKGQKAHSPDLLLHGLSVSFWTHCGNYIVATSGHWWGAFQIWQGVHVRNSLTLQTPRQTWRQWMKRFQESREHLAWRNTQNTCRKRPLVHHHISPCHHGRLTEANAQVFRLWYTNCK